MEDFKFLSPNEYEELLDFISHELLENAYDVTKSNKEIEAKRHNLVMLMSVLIEQKRIAHVFSVM